METKAFRMPGRAYALIISSGKTDALPVRFVGGPQAPPASPAQSLETSRAADATKPNSWVVGVGLLWRIERRARWSSWLAAMRGL
jgi:hypothetical protein